MCGRHEAAALARHRGDNRPCASCCAAASLAFELEAEAQTCSTAPPKRRRRRVTRHGVTNGYNLRSSHAVRIAHSVHLVQGAGVEATWDQRRALIPCVEPSSTVHSATQCGLRIEPSQRPPSPLLVLRDLFVFSSRPNLARSALTVPQSGPKSVSTCPSSRKQQDSYRQLAPIAIMTNPVIEVAPPSNTAAEPEHAVAADEDCSKEYEPVVKLEQVETKTGEEDEDVLFKMRAKLFRFSKDPREWKERGTGDVRILKHKQTKKIRLLMRREKTLKICMNQYVNPNTELRENVGSERSWVWHAIDYADDERDQALLAIRFRDSKDAKAFKDAYDIARQHMATLREQDPSASPKAEGNGSAAAETTTETKTKDCCCATKETAEPKSS
ncbi:Ran binding protein [Gracilaria domingensis]|nr:Ran binding protein [Gracilaria domingensis]